MNLTRAFTQHPATVRETYWQHLGFAVRFGARMIGGGLACMIHGFLPFTFVTRGSETVRALHATLERQRPLRAETAARTQGAIIR
ncbi:MAG: hypothetical protein IT518_21975 [Burkholderiales bacterium]|nr:hypothetical protein [Burkholderiales bacterium]